MLRHCKHTLRSRRFSNEDWGRVNDGGRSVGAFFQNPINSFIEDTCVVVVIAYLLTRGRMLALLTSEPRTRAGIWSLGIVFGVVGLTESIFPGARFPYVTHTLIVKIGR